MNGVVPYRPEGEVIDPNMHEALFQIPDPSKKPGTVGAVTKVSASMIMSHDVLWLCQVLCNLKTTVSYLQTGYKMHDRVLRAAEVGVVADPTQ